MDSFRGRGRAAFPAGAYDEEESKRLERKSTFSPTIRIQKLSKDTEEHALDTFCRQSETESIRLGFSNASIIIQRLLPQFLIKRKGLLYLTDFTFKTLT